MDAVWQVRTFAIRAGQAVPVIVRSGHVQPSPEILGVPDGAAGLRRVRQILADSGLPLRQPSAIDIRPAQPGAWPGLDLPLTVAMLLAERRLPQSALDRLVITAEVTAAGGLGPVEGIEAIAVQTAARGLTLLCAESQASEAAAAADGELLGARDLAEALDHLGSRTLLIPTMAEQARPAPVGFSDRVGPLVGGAVRGALASASIRADVPVLPEPAAGPSDVAPPFASTGPHGHRGRMRQRVLERGPDSLADYELLEMLLFLAFQRGDTKPLAKRVINQFGSFAGALSASREALVATPGLGEHAVTAMMIVREAATRLSRTELVDRPVLNNWDKLIAYLTAVMARQPVEQFRVLFLDARNRLIADEAQARGTVNHTPVYPREVVKRALELHATALLLVHNHPSGDPTPSSDDVEMTRDVKRAAAALGIVLHDHVIIGAGGWKSLRKEDLL